MSIGDKERLDGLFRKAFKRGSCCHVFKVDELINDADRKLFRQISPPYTLSPSPPAPTKTTQPTTVPQKPRTQLLIAAHRILTVQKFVCRPK